MNTATENWLNRQVEQSVDIGFNQAIDYYNKALEINNTPEILYDLSFIFMVLKQFDQGFKLYENRLSFNNPAQGEPRLELPELKIWNGKDKCNHLLIVSEQGLGDNILFYRYIIELSEKYPNMIITFFCRKQIHHIFKKYKIVFYIYFLSYIWISNNYLLNYGIYS